VRAEDIRCDVSGTSLDVVHAGGRFRISSPLLGRFHADNLLGAAAAGLSLGMNAEEIADGCAAVTRVPGRLEPVEAGQPYQIIVDYAHTEDALKSLLLAVRDLTDRKIILVFGCGGDRDRGKRAEMGMAAEKGADVVIITNDNPRTENPDQILDDIEKGMTPGKHERILKRKSAIHRALDIVHPGDVVLLAGKGHENYQIIGTTKLPFDEKIIVSELLAGTAA
jgi:UDP-N-acetylmuramoyl-L-alanyl-D-glutamate--2,6-diaminopimelate ligase